MYGLQKVKWFLRYVGPMFHNLFIIIIDMKTISTTSMEEDVFQGKGPISN